MRLAAAIGTLLALTSVPPVHGHAFLDHAEPRVGSTVQAPPAEVKIWFTQEIEQAFSSVNVRDAKGERVNTADSRVDATDHTLLRVPLEALPPGNYKVEWRVVSVDTHVTEGDFVFHVGQ